MNKPFKEIVEQHSESQSITTRDAKRELRLLVKKSIAKQSIKDEIEYFECEDNIFEQSKRHLEIIRENKYNQELYAHIENMLDSHNCWYEMKRLGVSPGTAIKITVIFWRAERIAREYDVELSRDQLRKFTTLYDYIPHEIITVYNATTKAGIISEKEWEK